MVFVRLFFVQHDAAHAALRTVAVDIKSRGRCKSKRNVPVTPHEVVLVIMSDGCAISQASVDIMLDLVIGKTKEEAMHLADLFFRMIKGTVSDEELEELEEASALVDISHMPARVKCAVLGWHTLTEMLGDEPEEK